VLCLLGAGPQAWPHLRVLIAALPSLSVVHVVGRDLARTQSFAADAGRRTSVTVTAVAHPAEATAGAEVVVAIDPDLTGEPAAPTAGALVVEHRAAVVGAEWVTLAPSGPVAGPRPVALPDVIAGRRAVRRSARDTVHLSPTGIAGWDVRLAAASLWRAWHFDIGMRFGLHHSPSG
jgi:ornithine cyclodeaminase/alanine dehydrogenase-like protein (mu-crystallin family)